jgi:hypothetical protein
MTRHGPLALAVSLAGAPFLSLGVATAAASPPTPTVLFVSPAGQGASCSEAAPCSLLAAQGTVRQIDSAMGSDITVVLEDGVYELTQPLTFGPQDSGTNGYHVLYTAAAGAHPVLSGARSVTGWQLVPGSTATWVAAVPPGFDTRQLYVDGRRVPMATGLPSSTTFLQTPTGFVTTSPVLAGWTDPSNISVVFKAGNGAWTQTSCNIATVVATTVTMAQPCWGNLHLPGEGIQELAWVDGPQGGFGGLSPLAMPTYLENAYELLSPGHWSIDRTSHVIYYDALPGQDLGRASVVAPLLQTLIDVSGTLDSPVHDLAIHGLQVSYATWTGPDTNDGFAQMQADWMLTGPNAAATQGTCQYANPPGTCPFASWTRTPAAVVLSATQGVTLDGNTFSHLGGAGVDVYFGSQHDVIKGNEFTDIAASAIQLGSTNDPLPADVGSDQREINSGNTITDNYIHDVANQYLGGVGIWVGYAQHTMISHNQIDDVPYTAISMGWGGWHTSFINPDADPNVNSGNVITDNLMFNYMTTLGDGGAIYTNGRQAAGWPDSLILSGNVAFQGTNTDFSLYTDAGSQFVTLNNNVVYGQPVDSFATGGCHTVGHIRVAGNYFSQLGPIYPCDLAVDVVADDNRLICTDLGPGQVPNSLLAAAGIEPAARPLLAHGNPVVTGAAPKSLPLSGGTVLVSGSGFDTSTQVWFGADRATTVSVLSGNYLLAGAPPGSGTVDVTVTTTAGRSATNLSDQVSRQLLPLPCLPLVGGNFSTALLG